MRTKEKEEVKAADGLKDGQVPMTKEQDNYSSPNSAERAVNRSEASENNEGLSPEDRHPSNR